ncbi:MAG: hypothetical protein ABI690_33505 [Chloroflexota bacterium]
MTKTSSNGQNPISIWPRSGGNRSNQSRISVPGPTKGEVFKKVRLRGLDRDEQGNRPETAGGVVAADGSLRVVSHGVLYALSPKGKILWYRSLPKYIPETLAEWGIAVHLTDDDFKAVPCWHSLLCIMNHDCILLTICWNAIVLDGYGKIIDQISIANPDESPLSPNLTLNHKPILTTTYDGVFIWDKNGLVDLNVNGYDIVPPAVYDDGTLGISAYSGYGYCRVQVDGTVVWKAAPYFADLVPTINHAQYAAVGSLDDEFSVIFSPDGQSVGRYNAPATFAVCANDEWIALSEKQVARLTHTGEVLWTFPISLDHYAWRRSQPIVDSQERIYFPDNRQLVALEGDGREIWKLKLSDDPLSIFPVSAGVFGVMVDETLWFIH